MKTYIITLALLLFATFGYSQDLFVYGNVVNTDGSPAQDVPLQISTDADGNIYDVLTDLDGHYELNIDVSTTQGMINVTMQNCNGEQLVQEGFWFPGITEFQADFEYCSSTSDCSLWILDFIDASGNVHLYAESDILTDDYEYTWSTGEVGAAISVYENGIYCVTVTSASCADGSNSACFAVNVDPCSIELFVNETDDDGLTVQWAPNIAALSYSWSTGETTEIIYPTADGEYCVEVAFANDCISSQCYYVGTSNCSVDIVEEDPAVIFPNALTAHATGQGPYTYIWSTGEVYQTISVFDVGPYCVTITDVTGCEAEACFDWMPGANCGVTVQVFTSPDAAILASTATGVSPISYQWSNGGDGDELTVNESGLYCLTITDANACTSVWCDQVDLETTIDCDVEFNVNADGTEIEAIGYGVPPYTYEWSNGETASTIPLNPGTLCITVTDSEGCNAYDCYAFLTECAVFVSVDSTGNGNFLVANGIGSPPYTFTWDNGDVSETLEVFQEGTYCVTMTDVIGCEISTCLDYVNGSGTWCNTQILEDYTIGGGGILTTSNSGGEGPYSYIWSTGETTSSISVTEGSYCLTVVDALGCLDTDCIDFDPNDACDVSIYSSGPGVLQAYGYGQFDWSYEWSTGSYDSYIDVTESGNYCLTLTDEVGCISTDCYEIDVDTITWCDVWINSSNSGTSGILLTANVSNSSVAPFTYLWSTGETTPTVTVMSGTYCVTITDANGCEAEDCITVQNNNCPVDILLETDPDGNPQLSAYAGDFGVTYQWNTGELTQTISPLQSGDYCVVATQADGCEDEACFVYENGIASEFYIHGVVTTPQDIELEGVAYLIVHDEIAGTLTAIDQVDLVSDSLGHASYEFNNLLEGQYLVKAALNEGAEGWESNMPTYYGNSLFWFLASDINVPTQWGTLHYINLLQGNNPGGPGFIGGLISEGANFSDGPVTDGNSSTDEGDPIADVSILLLDMNDNPIAHAISNEDGEYSFENIPYGTYQVVTEILGFEQAMYVITIGPNNPTVNNADFIVDDNSASTVLAIEDLIETDAIQLYPNPTTATAILNMNVRAAGLLSVNIQSISGQLMATTSHQVATGTTEIELDLSALESGLYFIQISDGATSVTKKIVKQ